MRNPILQTLKSLATELAGIWAVVTTAKSIAQVSCRQDKVLLRLCAYAAVKHQHGLHAQTKSSGPRELSPKSQCPFSAGTWVDHILMYKLGTNFPSIVF